MANETIEELREVEKKPLWQRVGWLLVIWTGSVLALAVVAGVLKVFMKMAGLTVH